MENVTFNSTKLVDQSVFKKTKEEKELLKQLKKKHNEHIKNSGKQ